MLEPSDVQNSSGIRIHGVRAKEGKRRHVAEERVIRLEGPLRKAAYEEGISFKNLLRCHIGTNQIEKTIKEVSKKFKVTEKELMNYFEKEMLST